MAQTTDNYLTSSQAAHLMGLSRSWLEKRRVAGDGPPYFKISPRRVLYRQSDLTDWLERHRTHSTSEAPSYATKDTTKQGVSQ